MNDNLIKDQKKLLAFVHIEKAAGTTLIHLLRANFIFRYWDVKSLTKTPHKVFTAQDMRTILKFNPLTCCIGGHDVKPFSDLKKHYPKIRYITLLRSPIERYISHYQYWREQLGYKLSFKDFLEETKLNNFQTKKIAGEDNLVKAKELLTNDFFLIGLVESFDEFILLLRYKLRPFRFIPYYEKKNVASRHSPLRDSLKEEIETFKTKIIENNQNDILLYEYVKSHLKSKEKAIYGSNFQSELMKFKNNNSKKSLKYRAYLDYVFRKGYNEPILRAIQRRNRNIFQ